MSTCSPPLGFPLMHISLLAIDLHSCLHSLIPEARRPHGIQLNGSFRSSASQSSNKYWFRQISCIRLPGREEGERLQKSMLESRTCDRMPSDSDVTIHTSVASRVSQQRTENGTEFRVRFPRRGTTKWRCGDSSSNFEHRTRRDAVLDARFPSERKFRTRPEWNEPQDPLSPPVEESLRGTLKVHIRVLSPRVD